YSTNNIYIKIDNSIEDYEEKVSLNNLDKDLETMIVAIKQNKKITDFERDVFLSNINFYIENINYIDVNEISNRLKKLEIESNNNRKKYNVNNNVLAIYSKPENKIVNFHTDDTKTLPKDILTHEFMHIHSSKIYKFGLSLMEALTEIMQHEYFYKYDETTGPYKEHCMYVRVLCEIIGAEPLKKFFFSGNINYIYKELLKLDNDYDRITNLIDNMDSLLAAINNYDIDMTNDKKDILRQVMDSSRENIENDLKHYFKLARGYNVEDDKVISTYFNVVADNYYPVYYNDEEIYTYDFIYKGYFSEQYIKANPSLILHVSSYNYETDSIVNDSITIKDEDRIQNSKAYH
ncbi:MAG TPA: hypothetical protein GX747_02245, partial [Tenericutes bacterium]|nr:hypothetical protein [Mycoplasmatota bacterium]